MNVTVLFLDRIPLWVVFSFSLTITLLSTEFGYRSGKRKRRTLANADTVVAGPFVAASLGLLAFLLAMVFSAVQYRFHQVKEVAIAEANTIGTAYMRTDLLPIPDRTEARQLLHDYVALHVEALEDGSEQQIERAIHRSEEMHRVLWSIAATFANQQPSPTSVFIHCQ